MWVKMIEWLSIRDNVTFLIAIAGFLMSIYNFFRAMWDKRCSFKIDYISHYSSLSRSKKYAEVIMRLNFVNRSTAPLTVVRMFFIVDGKEYEFLFPEQAVHEMTRIENGETRQISEVKSQKLPFSVDGNGALGGYFAVLLPKEMEKRFQTSGKWNLKIYTNRKIKTLSIIADNPGYDIEQYRP